MAKFKKFKRKFKKIYKRKFRKYFKKKKWLKRKKYRPPFQNRMKVKMFWRIPAKGYDIKGDTGGEITRYDYYKINSLNPLGITTEQPQYYDQIKSIYDRYRVTGVKYKLQFRLQSNTYPAVDVPAPAHFRGLIVNVGVDPNGLNILPGAGTSMTSATARKVGTNPGIKQKTLYYDPQKTSVATFTKYVDFRKVIGNKGEYMSSYDYAAGMDADPIKPLYLAWTATKLDDSILDDSVVFVSGWMKFYTQCDRRAIDVKDV